VETSDFSAKGYPRTPSMILPPGIDGYYYRDSISYPTNMMSSGKVPGTWYTRRSVVKELISRALIDISPFDRATTI